MTHSGPGLFPGSRFEGNLEGRLQRGKLPLAYALRCAADVAMTLRELHRAGRAHGQVEPSSVLLFPYGAILELPARKPQLADPGPDVRAFGSLLYRMLTGREPAESVRFHAAKFTPGTSPEALLAAGIRLAARCLGGPKGIAPDVGGVVTEVRLLGVLARQYGVVGG